MAAAGGPLDAGRPELTSRERGIAGVTALFLLIGMPIAWIGGDVSAGQVVGMIAVTIVMLAALAAIFLWLVPRERAVPGRPARAGLILGIVAVVTVVVFWTGLPFPLGAGAIALGLIGREQATPSSGQGRATAAIALGTLAIVVAFVALLFG